MGDGAESHLDLQLPIESALARQWRFFESFQVGAVLVQPLCVDSTLRAHHGKAVQAL